MKQFLIFSRKEFLHIFRDGRTMLILLVMPIVLICIFGFAISTEVKNTRVVVLDKMLTPESRTIIGAIDANTYFTLVTSKPDRSAPSDAHLSENLKNSDLSSPIRRGEADVVIILDPDRGVQIIADGSEPNQAQVRMGYLQNIMKEHRSPEFHAPAPGIQYLYNPQLRSEYNFVPGIIGVIVMLICAMMTSISIVREKEMGTMEILLASPLSPAIIVGAKLTPYFIISSINLVSILLLGKYAFDLPIGAVGVGWTAIPSFLLLSMVYVFVALALGLLISCVVRTQLAAMLLSLLLIVPAIYLSGMVFPIESMPTAFQRVSRIVPARWFIDGARRLLIQGVEFRYIVKDLGVLCLEAVVLVALSIRLFKTRLE